MATPIVTKTYKLRSSSPMPKFARGAGTGCPTGAPTKYVIQSFGVDVTDVDNWGAITGLYASEVMQGLQNYEDTDAFRAHAYVRISYTGSNSRDTDGNKVFKGVEEHSSKWMDEQASGLIWIR